MAHPSEIGITHKDGAGRRDAFHVPAVRVHAAVPLEPGQWVRFINSEMVHPSDGPAEYIASCDNCGDKKVLKWRWKPEGRGSSTQELCNDCYTDEDESWSYGEATEIEPASGNGAKQALVDPFLKEPVTPGEIVWVLPVPELVGKVEHQFTLHGIGTSGSYRWVDDDDEEWLNDSCRGCY